MALWTDPPHFNNIRLGIDIYKVYLQVVKIKCVPKSDDIKRCHLKIDTS